MKSAILLAGLVRAASPVDGHASRRARAITRSACCAPQGVDVVSVATSRAARSPRRELAPLDIDVPGDPSSAAFFAALAALAPTAGSLAPPTSALNPTRTGFFARARATWARDVDVLDRERRRGEPVGDDHGDGRRDAARRSRSARGEVPSLIDELPLAGLPRHVRRGRDRDRGAEELRVKESDRIAAVVREPARARRRRRRAARRAARARHARRRCAARVATHGDHRLAMAFGVLGALPGNAIEIDDPRMRRRVVSRTSGAISRGSPRDVTATRGARSSSRSTGRPRPGKSSTAHGWRGARLPPRRFGRAVSRRDGGGAAHGDRRRASGPRTRVLDAARSVTLQPRETSFAPCIDGERRRGGDPRPERDAARVARGADAARARVGERAGARGRRRSTTSWSTAGTWGRRFSRTRREGLPGRRPWERARRRLIQRLGRRPTDAEIAEETDRLVQRDAQDATQTVQARTRS